MPIKVTAKRKKLVAKVVRLVTVEGLTHAAAGAQVGITKDAVSNIILRHRRPDYDKLHYRKAVDNPGCQDWDGRLFEPWSERKLRRERERAHG